MPVTIACPKCQTKYKLPDSALGKPVKCQKCGANFRTPAPKQTAAAQQKPLGQQSGQPAAPAKQQPSPQELAQLGIKGPIKRQADIFSAPPPSPRSNPLGNFVLEDPGFADVDQARQEAREEEGLEGTGDGMEAILSNPYASPLSLTKNKKKSGPEIDFRSYKAARIGMQIVYFSWIIILTTPLGIAALGLLTFFARNLAPITGAIISGMAGLILIAIGMVFVGQIVCIFAPNKNERIYAGLAVGSMVLAILLPIIGGIMGAFAGAVVGEEGSGQIAAAAMGLVMLILIVSSYILALSNMFFFITYFKKIGKNIRSKDLKSSAGSALGTWIVAIIGAILCTIATFVVTSIFEPENAQKIVGIIGLVNLILAFAVMCTLFGMLSSGIKNTRASVKIPKVSSGPPFCCLTILNEI